MAEGTSIEWADHTFNPWWGCTKVSEACRHCYAESWSKRFAATSLWGKTSRRRFFGKDHWRKPVLWNKRAKEAGRRARVFCASMADVFEVLDDDHPDRVALGMARQRLWNLIERSPWLDWLLLTKRPENLCLAATLSMPNGRMPPHVWLGTTIEDQPSADERLPQLLSFPAAVHFASCEPLLGPIDLEAVPTSGTHRRLDWVICGGESGHHARAMDPSWVRALRDTCERHRVAFFFKQWGAWAPAFLAGPDGPAHFINLGKKRSGRELDGRTHDALPTTYARAS